MYIRALSSVSDGYSARVDLQVYESHTEKWEGPQPGLSPCQGRGYSLPIYASRYLNDGLHCVFPVFPLNKSHIW